MTEEQTSIPWFARRYMWTYAVLAIAAGYVSIDRLLPTHVVASTIVSADENKVNISSYRRNRYSGPPTYTYWCTVTLANGVILKYQSAAANFPVGQAMLAEVTAYREDVLRFKLDQGVFNTWTEPESADDEYRPFPLLVFVFATLLLLPWWSLAARAAMTMGLIVFLLGWMLVLIGAGG